MIVVDNDVISYFWIQMETERSGYARRARARDTVWVAPRLWRSEFRNVLRAYMAGGYMTFAEAIAIARDAEADLANPTYEVDTRDVLRLVDSTGHSAYDCEYVALAQTLDVPLVTGDRRLPDLFPETAVLLEDFAEEKDDSSN
jgi:predicted nucleic acid-binding protein